MCILLTVMLFSPLVNMLALTWTEAQKSIFRGIEMKNEKILWQPEALYFVFYGKPNDFSFHYIQHFIRTYTHILVQSHTTIRS